MSYSLQPGRPAPLAVGLVFVVSLLAAACGSSAGSEQGVASLGESTVEPTVAAEAAPSPDALEAPDNPEDAFALFSECMTDAGFDFGGAVVVGGAGGADSSIEVEELDGGIGDSDADPQSGAASPGDFDAEAFDEANEVCETHLANLDGGFDMSPEQEAAFEDAQLEWSECMRDQGVEVPESEAGTGAVVVAEVGEDVEIDPQTGQPSFDDLDFDFDGFEDAAEACQYVYDQYDELDGLFEEQGQ